MAHRRGFTVPEMLAVVAIIIILLSMLLPMLGKGKDSARQAQCASNQHQIGVAIRSFIAAKLRGPTAGETLASLGPYLENQDAEIYYCPELPVKFMVSYGVNPCIHKLKGEPAKVMLLDAKDQIIYYEGTSSATWVNSVSPRHFGKNMNVLMQDISVSQQQPTDINPYISAAMRDDRWKPKQACNPNDASAIGEGGCGCTATYYTGHFGGTSATRIDHTLDMPFGGAFFGHSNWNIPLPNSNQGGWDTGSFGSGTWVGKIRFNSSEPHTFYLACDNEAWLYVNGQMVIHRSTGGVEGVTSYEASAPVVLEAGKWVDIEVRLLELTPGQSPSHVSIYWESPTMPRSIIPCTSLKPK